MTRHRLYATSFASVYPHYVAKAEKKGRTKAEVDEIILWLTGFAPAAFEEHLAQRTDFETFFAQAPALNPARLAITGSIFIFVTARAMYLAPDALSQFNMVGPAVGLGLPLLIAANLVYSFATEGFVLGYLIRAIVAITALLVVSSVGSSVMGRALHATHWDHTVPLSGGKRAKDSF